MWQPPWHDAVKSVRPNSSVQQAIADANLGVFSVRDSKPGKRELLCEHPESPASARSLGLIRSNHVPLQNNEAFALFQPLVDSGCLSIDSACDWKGGWRVWMVFRILKYETAADLDHLRPFLLFGHDPFTNYFKLSYLLVRAATNGILTEGTYHNPGPSIPPHDHLPRRFSSGHEKACEEIQDHLSGVISTFRRMNRLPISPHEADGYLLEVARRTQKFRRSGLSDGQVNQLHAECKERLSRRDVSVHDKQTTLWTAYTTVIEWIDRESATLHGWERLKELWSSSIKDDALYVALQIIGT